MGIVHTILVYYASYFELVRMGQTDGRLNGEEP